jgi:UDP-N-acetylmuramate dehydrogenase
MTLHEHAPLARFTTLGLGGPARLLATCESLEDLREAFRAARSRKLRVVVIGGGSNLIVPDAGYDGLVAKLCSRGISEQPAGQDVLVTAAAGEPWDEFVAYTIEQGWGGLECLSGIPGLAGATPIQNVGAYGQEVAETITSVEALYPGTLERRRLGPEACGFGYRTSAFKAGALRELIVVAVTFRLRRDAAPAVRYPELQRLVETVPGGSSLPPGAPGLRTVRNAVLQLRRRKSMVIDPSDPHTRSAGSFFTNPVLTPEAYHAATATWKRSGSAEEIPSYPSGEQIKVPAAWLVEHAGFARGYREGNVGISANHALALVNYGGTTTALLALANRIQNAVRDRFGIALAREPVLLQ